jgi:hypothetical protein
MPPQNQLAIPARDGTFMGVARRRKPDSLTAALLNDTRHLIETSQRLVELSLNEAAEARALAAKSEKIVLASQKRLKRLRDPIALAKLIGDIAPGQMEDKVENKRDQAAVAMGRRAARREPAS